MKIAEMSPDLLEFVVNKAVVGQEQFNSEREIASYMKAELEEQYAFFPSSSSFSLFRILRVVCFRCASAA